MAGDEDVLRLLEAILETGLSPEEVCQADPELLPRVRERLRQLRRLESQVDVLFPPASPAVAGLSSSASRFSTVEPPQLPNYEVQAELGRGGMGVVYRAWDSRLNRPVALKMLLAGAYARPAERERFRRESEAAAGLRHVHIVQVYDVGEFDGRPYFIMECVEGGSLAQKLSGAPLPAVQAAALLVTLAEAVKAAHDRGIVHRDLKPGNILLAADGTPKITDFGLARRLEDTSGLTHTGATLGTPSYMAPEQARGETQAVGTAADVYALGAILYETLTGRPPFRGSTAAETVRQVVEQEPPPPSRWNATVPRDLEVICLTCLNKEPHRRYPSAAALADDLRRFERGEPILARPLGRLARLVRWARRRPAAAGLCIALLATALLALALAGGGLWLIGQRQATARYAEQDLREADDLLRQSKLTGAHAALERVKGRLGPGGSLALRQRVGVAEADLHRREAEEQTTRHLKQRLEAIRMDRCVIVTGADVDWLTPDREYEKAFRSAGLDVFEKNPTVVAEWIKDSPARAALLAALDDWAIIAANAQRRDWLLAVARHADPDPSRDRVRDSATFGDMPTLKELARKVPPEQAQSVQLLISLGQRLLSADRGAAVPFLRQVQHEHPDDYYANLWLGLALDDRREKVGYFRAALALRPDAQAANYNIGKALNEQGQATESLPYLQRAVQIDPLNAVAQGGLGKTLLDMGRIDKAIDHMQEALHLDSQLVWVRNNLGVAFEKKGRLDEATDHSEKAVALAPTATDNVEQETSRTSLIREGRMESARALWRKALDAGPKEHDAWFGYAELCLFLGNQEEYRRNRRELLARFGGSENPTVCERTGKACLLLPGTNDELEAAAALANRAVAAGPIGREFAYPYAVFANGLAAYRLGRFDEAIALMSGEASRAQLIEPSQRLVTAMAHYQKGQRDEALKTLAAAVVSHDWRTSNADSRDPWFTHILRREAEAMILPNLPAFLEGEYQPANNDERFALLGVCWAKALDGGPQADRVLARDRLTHLCADPDLARLFDPESLDGLPPAERQVRRTLRGQIDALIGRAQGTS